MPKTMWNLRAKFVHGFVSGLGILICGSLDQSAALRGAGYLCRHRHHMVSVA
jgi:hypothetical protein